MVSRPFSPLVLLSRIQFILGQFWILCATYMPRDGRFLIYERRRILLELCLYYQSENRANRQSQRLPEHDSGPCGIQKDILTLQKVVCQIGKSTTLNYNTIDGFPLSSSPIYISFHRDIFR